MNALRGHLAEFGVIAAQGTANLINIVTQCFDATEGPLLLPQLARSALKPLMEQIGELSMQIRQVESKLLEWHRNSAVSRRLETIPGIGYITATAITASVPDPALFRNGRQFAAWLGLTPKSNSSGGKEKLGAISRVGDSYLRTLLVVGATAVLRFARNKPTAATAWINGLLERRPARLVSVAMANKTARIAWVVLSRGEEYRAAVKMAA